LVGLLRSASAVDWSAVPATDTSLVDRCVDGDEEACRRLVETHQAMVFQLAFALLGDREEALDISQEVFLRVFRTLTSFRGDATLRTWIYRIVINQARNRQRSWMRRRRDAQISLDDYASVHGEPRATQQVGADVRLERRELATRMRAAIGELPFEQRSALVLREFHGMRYQEIAFSLGVTVGTVKSRLARGRTALRGSMKELWPR
jgi:RNA polymerase sigma-70 factor (ECF subfamily)